MTVTRALRLLSVIAAAGLLVLTITTVVRPPAAAQNGSVTTVVVAWVAVLAITLASLGPGVSNRNPAARAADVPAPRHGLSPTDDLDVLRFAQELNGTLQDGRLDDLIARRLSAFAGGRDVWVVALFGDRQHIIVPARRGAPSAIAADEPRQWMTFPMKVNGQGIGVLGVSVQEGGLPERERRVLTMLADLVGQSLQTSNAFALMRETSLADSLTGCATRAEGLRRFEAELRRAERARTSLAVLMLDLDHFKRINDRFGHNTGDAVLSAIGGMLNKTLRASDIRCRWGGEEFLLVLTESSVERARRVCEALRGRIETTPVAAGAHALQVTASIGVTLTRPGEMDIQKLIARADSALYRAKDLGRNRVEFPLPDVPADEPVPFPERTRAV